MLSRRKLITGAAALAAYTALESRAEAGRTGYGQPVAAANAGYNNLIFSDDFTSTATIDVTNSKIAGFNWYLANWFTRGASATNANNINVANSILTLGGGTGNPVIVTAFDTSSTAFTGTVFGTGGYFEARLKFLNDGVQAPFFFCEAIEHIYDSNAAGDAHWPGQIANYSHFAEVDVFEPLGGSLTSYQSTIHDWSGVEVANVVPNNIANGTLNVRNVAPVNWSSFHNYGLLWVPQNGATPGHITTYFDGVAGATTYYIGPVGSPPLSSDGGAGTSWSPSTAGAAAATYSILDQQRLALTLGSNVGVPMQIDWVKVWK